MRCGADLHEVPLDDVESLCRSCEEVNAHASRMTFHDLHHGDAPLLLPNAWDVASALAFAEAGFPAIGTTSFGVAAAAGRADGGRSSRDATAALARALSVLTNPVSADVEDGYADDPEAVADFVAGLGVAGINIEDSTAERLIAPEAHAAKVAAIKRRSPNVFVNARVDTYWLGQDATVQATLDRARAYVDAGADGIFVPGATEPEDLRRLCAGIPVPVNVLVVPGLSLAELAELGVRRVSTGSLPYRAAMDAAVEVAASVRDGRTPPQATAYPEMQRRLVRFEGLSP
jgi:2-methylisocitrate lyase-like PEP mutase family enzyme